MTLAAVAKCLQAATWLVARGNKFILLELNQRNEIRADVNLTIKSLEITEIENINVKIDTGCPYTSIPVRKLGISNE